MEFNKEYKCLDHNDIIFSKTIDCEKEYQQALPQYCDDILKVIKCESKNVITSTNIDNGLVKIYGKTYINLTYENENNELTYADFEEDFENSINVENATNNALIKSAICNKYTNYRIINQRRIDVHIAYCIKLSVIDKVSCPCMTTCENSKLRKSTKKCSNIVSVCKSKCEFDEEVTIPQDSKPIKHIIGCSGFVTLNETKTIKDKALVKANVTLNVLYTEDCDKESISKCSYNFDISKIVEINGLLESDYIVTNAKLGNVFLKSKNSDKGCLNIIEAIGDVSFELTVIRETDIDYVTDCYIVNRKSKCNYQDYNANVDCRKINDTIQRELKVKLNSEISKVIDVGLTINDVQLKSNKCVASICSNIIYCDAEDVINTFETVQDISIFDDNFSDGIVSVDICDYDFIIKDANEICIRTKLKYCAILYNVLNEKVVTEIECEDEMINYPELTIYFAKMNESVWNIAKRFSSDVELIMKENELSQDVLASNKVLIIPGV